jgi:hypothetical protein
MSAYGAEYKVAYSEDQPFRCLQHSDAKLDAENDALRIGTETKTTTYCTSMRMVRSTKY